MGQPALATANDAALPAPTESAAILSVIERAARDPSVDVDKMERLMAMAERAQDRTAKAAYLNALAEMQPELPEINERGGIKNAAGKVQSTYAKWEDINTAIRPILHRHGFALSFRIGQENGQIAVTGVLGHRDGHTEETVILLPADNSGSKNSVQAVGSSTSYGKRYTAMALLNITTRGEDDDGKAAGARGASAGAQAAMASMNACNTIAELREWKAKNAAGLDALSKEEASAVIRACNDRVARLKEAGR